MVEFPSDQYADRETQGIDCTIILLLLESTVLVRQHIWSKCELKHNLDSNAKLYLEKLEPLVESEASFSHDTDDQVHEDQNVHDTV